MAVTALKSELLAICNIPVDRQRLIYKGRVLRDDQRLNDVGKQRWPPKPVGLLVISVITGPLVCRRAIWTYHPSCRKTRRCYPQPRSVLLQCIAL